MNNATDTSASSAAPMTLDAIYTDKIFEPKMLRQPHWLKDGKHFSFLDAAPKQEPAQTQTTDTKADGKQAAGKEAADKELLTLWIFDVERRQRAPILAAEVLQTGEEPLTIHGYQWSPDETRVLLARQPHAHAPEGDKELWIYTLATRALTCVARGGDDTFRSIKWSPDGLRLGYVRADDLYVLDLESGTERRLTNDASPAVYNGRFGWVYQEELYLVDGWAWSPDGQHIAYCQCDETAVPVVPLTRYETLHLAPELQRYPKAGDTNPVVRVAVVKAIEEETKTPGIEAPAEGEALSSSPLLPLSPSTLWLDTGPDADIYIAQIQWTPGGELLIQRIPRLQNQVDLLRADLQTGTTTVVMTETDAAWVDAPGKLIFASDNGDFVWPSDRDGWRHLYLYDRNGQMQRQLTHGEWDVNGIVAADSVNGRVYFTAAHPLPREQHLFTVGLDGGDMTQITTGAGTHSALFSPDASLFLHTYSARMTPPQAEVCRANGQPVVTVVDNPMPEARAHLLSEWEFITLPVKDGGTENDGGTGGEIQLEAALLRPPDFDPTREYPLLMYTYGGPGSQVVVDAWGSRIGLEQYLAQQGYVLALVDGRGAGGRGRDFKKITYLNLGQYEANDQIAAAQKLASLPYIDAGRIGIWGWSYGGFMASLCILRGADVFKAAVAVAPVTDFKLYDSIYTERYMRRPSDNADGYERNAPLKYAANLKGKFLLVHGLDDDNVHFQNAAQLAALLQQHNKPFQMMAYPGKHHGLEGVAPHWAALIADFIRHNL